MKLRGKCCMGVAFEGSCPIPPGDILGIPTPMLESTRAMHALMDLQLIQVCPAHLMRSGCVAVRAIPTAFLWWHSLEAQQGQCTLSLIKRGSASHFFGALKTSCGGGGFNSGKC